MFLIFALMLPPDYEEVEPTPEPVVAESLFSDLILAGMMLDAPPQAREVVPPDRWEAMRSALWRVAIDRELLDVRECRYVFNSYDDFAADLDFLRQRNLQFKDAPLFDDWFPDAKYIERQIEFNRAYRKNLVERLRWESDRSDTITAVIRETEQLYRVWDAIREVKGEFQYVTYRRQKLAEIRDLLGREAYDNRQLPDCVPTWRFIPGGQ